MQFIMAVLMVQHLVADLIFICAATVILLAAAMPMQETRMPVHVTKICWLELTTF